MRVERKLFGYIEEIDVIHDDGMQYRLNNDLRKRKAFTDKQCIKRAFAFRKKDKGEFKIKAEVLKNALFKAVKVV